MMLQGQFGKVLCSEVQLKHDLVVSVMRKIDSLAQYCASQIRYLGWLKRGFAMSCFPYAGESALLNEMGQTVV